MRLNRALWKLSERFAEQVSRPIPPIDKEFPSDLIDAGEPLATYHLNSEVTGAHLVHLAKMSANKRVHKGNKLGALMRLTAAYKL
ncbi:hypothetical protein [Halomonas sp. N3-2A]|uniref:hypothetical protein n=1 Tax=Halomonas sp. N3-2A TaxID=2014541 RepID=UPI000B5B1C03|nr:hypothetical protein [Halomonas sp. N3-2A]ASK17866.1 hypothetical protein CEK60_00400 [Halomonas sp. N3-2A]